MHHSDKAATMPASSSSGGWSITASPLRYGELLLLNENREDGTEGVWNRDYAKADVLDYIERSYNPKCRHSTLGYFSPNEFENKVGLA